jgi:EAL and modified HD-GYP domain-containing signal transduction protein
MDIYLGRQPILDTRQRTVAYELLYRSSLQNAFSQTDGETATSTVLHNLFCALGIEQVCGKKKAFINFPDKILLDGLPALEPRQIVVEILETVTVTPDIVEACKKLAQRGFVLALDDFVFDGSFDELLDLATIVKVDWRAVQGQDMKRLLDSISRHNLALLAEKIETEEEFQRAKELGFVLFQGYFFAKPIVITGKALQPAMVSLLKLMVELNRPEMDMQVIARLIQNDPALCFKFLKIINSAAFGLRTTVSSVEQAIAFIGEKEVRRWLSIFLASRLSADRPSELMVSACLRAKTCENLVKVLNRNELASTVFFMGILSFMDAMLGKPLNEILEELPVVDEIKESLLQGKGELRPFMNVVLALEQHDETTIAAMAQQLQVPVSTLSQCYLDAMAWVNSYVVASMEQ